LFRQYELNAELFLENGRVDDNDLDVMYEKMTGTNVAEKEPEYHTQNDNLGR